MPQPSNADVPGWPPGWKWQDIVSDLDCQIRPLAKKEIDSETYEPFLMAKLDGLEIAKKRCAEYQAYLVSDEGIAEQLGIQNLDTEEDATLIIENGWFGEGTLPTSGIKLVQSFWKPATEEAWIVAKAQTPDLLPFVPYWNALDPHVKEYFCQYRPWVPIEVFKQSQARATKVNYLFIPGVKPPPWIMARPSCAGETVAQALEKTKAGTKAYIKDKIKAGKAQAKEARIKYYAPAEIAPADQSEEPPPPTPERNPLPLLLGGLGLATAGPLGAAGGYALGVALSPQTDRLNVGAPLYAENLLGQLQEAGGDLYMETVGAPFAYLIDLYFTGETTDPATAQECADWRSYLENLDATGFPTDALIAKMDGTAHDNARYLEQYKTLAPGDRENLNRCALAKGQAIIEEVAASLTPEEKAAAIARTDQLLAELQKAGKFQGGVLITQEPGQVSALNAVMQARAALDPSPFSGTINLLGVPVPKWVLWAGGAAAAAYIAAKIK